MAANTIFWKLNFEPEQLESSISTLKDHLDQTIEDGRHQHLENLAFEPEHLQSEISTFFHLNTHKESDSNIIFTV